MSPSRALTLLLLLTAAAAEAAAGASGSEVTVEASGDGPEVAEMVPVTSEDSEDEAELADEGLMKAEPAGAASAAEAHRQDLATRPKQPKRTVDVIRPEQELRPQLRPSSTSNGGGFIASKATNPTPGHGTTCMLTVCFHSNG